MRFNSNVNFILGLYKKSINLKIEDSKNKCSNLYNNIIKRHYTLNDIFNFLSPKFDIEPYVIFPLLNYKIIDTLVSNQIINNNKKKDDDVALKQFNQKADNILIYLPSDKDYGGSSINNIKHIINDIDNGVNESYFRWHGNLDFSSEDREKTKAKSGYCALKIDYNKSLDLLDYNGLLLKIRSLRSQKVIINIKCMTYIKDDMFQLCLEIPSSEEWKSIFVPFDLFVLTSKGYAKEQPMQNDSLNIESIVFLLKDDLMNMSISDEDTEGKNRTITKCQCINYNINTYICTYTAYIVSSCHQIFL